MAKNIITGIDVGTHSTRVLISEFSFRDGRPQLKILGAGRAETHGMRRGYVTNVKEVSESIHLAIEGAEKQSGIRVKNAFVTIGGINISSANTKGGVLVSKADGVIQPVDLDRVHKECERSLSVNNHAIIEVVPQEYYVDGEKVFGKPIGLKGKKLEAKMLFVTCFKQHIDYLSQAVESLGIDIVDMIASPVAESSILTTERQRIAGCAVVNIGAETVSISVFEHGLLYSVKVFDIGSVAITNDLALGLQVNLDKAEEMKSGGHSPDVPRRKFENIVESRVIEMCELVAKHLASIGRHKLLPAGVILSGGGSQISVLEETARKVLQVPITIASEISPLSKRYPSLSDPSWLSAYGLITIGKNSGNKQQEGFGAFKIFGELKSWISSITKQFKP